MKRMIWVALFTVLIVGITLAQGSLNINMPVAEKSRAIDAFGNTINHSHQRSRGPVIWNNEAVSSWWSGADVGYLNLDWAQLSDSNMLPDEEIDGFQFKYGTNNMDPAGESFAYYYFDQCTGWGNIGIQQAGFGFSGLPNGYGLPTLPPGFGWIWSISVDLAGSGYEFILNDDETFGQAISKQAVSFAGSTGPAIGRPGGYGGNDPFTGTEDAFDIYYPNGVYNGTWYFGGYPTWATWPGQLYGSGIADHMWYYGINAPNNPGQLYATGSFSASSGVHFMFALHGNSSQAFLLFGGNPEYKQGSYWTQLIRDPYTFTPMQSAFIGDFAVYDVFPPSAYDGVPVYFQAITGSGASTYASNGIMGTIYP